MPLIQRKGAQSSQGFGEFAQSTAATYIEDVFSTYLYTGTGATQTITNNINLSGNGGLVWIKDRTNAYNHNLFDTVQGATKYLHSNTTGATGTDAVSLTSFNANGFSLGTGNTAGSQVNTSADNFVSWTFRKQAKFFDIVTWTGDGTSARAISHALGSTPGFIVVKNTGAVSDWQCWHNAFSATELIKLNLASAKLTGTTLWGSTLPNSTTFTVGSANNTNAATYVAYLFAHDTASDGLIQCGSYTTNAAGDASVSLGWEPQYVLYKPSSTTGDWKVVDVMRGAPVGGSPQRLNPNLSAAESSGDALSPTATGFSINDGTASAHTGIYLAIRRGPMKTPTVGTSVFSPQIWTGNATARTISGTNNPVDLSIVTVRSNSGSGGDKLWNDRLRGASATLYSNYTQAEDAQPTYITGFDVQYGEKIGTALPVNGSSVTYVSEMLTRAPGFFDEVCYTGTGANTTQTHNLGVVPELMIVKERSAINAWQVYSATLANTQYLVLNTTAAAATGATRWNSTTPTSSVFSIGTDSTVNASTQTYVAYLFASCPGVSKVGSYTGTGATQTINCGFTGGARFVLIKRTDSTGNWYYWDTARGMVAGTDPYLQLDTNVAEVNANNVYTTGVGFQIVGTGAGINASGGTYIFWAVS